MSSRSCRVILNDISGDGIQKYSLSVVGLVLGSLFLECFRLQHPPMRVIMGAQGIIWNFFLLLAWSDYSVSFRRGLFFPDLLLLTAIPWPTRIEEPLTRALIGNLVRTLLLCLVASQKGMEVMERYHDRSGFALLVFLVVGMGGWSLGRISPPLRKESTGRFFLHFRHQSSRGMSLVLATGVILF